jgi:hypothetical protein
MALARAKKTIEEVKATHRHLYAQIRVAFALYDELRQADLIAPAMDALDDTALINFVAQRYEAAAKDDGDDMEGASLFT